MAKGIHQKEKMLILKEIFERETDEKHPLTLKEIQEKLEARGATAGRKTLYTDIDALRDYGMDIIGRPEGRDFVYYLGQRDFELAEVKLLVDTVQASRFLTDRKSRSLIRKISKLVSREEAKELSRDVMIQGRIKSMNESVYYNVDELHRAMAQGVKIRFQYLRYNMDKELEPRAKGQDYQVSPWGLVIDQDNYYLIAFDDWSREIRHYRVDKMRRIRQTEEEREGEEAFSGLDLARYKQRTFGMFSGETVKVSLRCENSAVDIVIDRFGDEIELFPQDEEHFLVNVDVALSRQFLGWVLALGGLVTVEGPSEAVQAMQALLLDQGAYYL